MYDVSNPTKCIAYLKINKKKKKLYLGGFVQEVYHVTINKINHLTFILVSKEEQSFPFVFPR